MQIGFQALRPYLSSGVWNEILHICSGAEIAPEDLTKAGQRVLNDLSATVSKELADVIKAQPFIERSEEIERLFLLWDEIPRTSAATYQRMVELVFPNAEIQ